MIARFLRVFKHRWLDEGAVRRQIGAAALQRLGERVAAAERGHGGQIRVCIEGGLPLDALWRHTSARQRALGLFGQLGVWDTEHNNGVLLYLLMAERAIEIVADRGLAPQVPASHWSALVARMQPAFSAGRFEDGLTAAIDAIGDELREHFPLADGASQNNELPDAPLVL